MPELTGPIVLLNWRDASHFSPTARACALCGKQTHLRSQNGEPVDKTCAEMWNAEHPERAGEGRFVSDPEPRSRKRDAGAHA